LRPLAAAVAETPTRGFRIVAIRHRLGRLAAGPIYSAFYFFCARPINVVMSNPAASLAMAAFDAQKVEVGDSGAPVIVNCSDRFHL